MFVKQHRFARRIILLAAIVTVAEIADRAAAVLPAYYVTDLGTLGGTESFAWSLNGKGQVTGYADTTNDVTVDAFLWTPTTLNGASGSMQDLGTLGGTFSWGIGINESGTVAGVAATTGDVAEHATLWIPTTPNGTTGTLYGLGTLGGTYSQANAVNASGQAAGFSDLTGDDESHAFMWKPTTPGGATGTMYDLGSLGGTFAIAWDINANGMATGDSDTTNDEATRAFIWIPTTPNAITGAMHDLGTLGGTTSYGGGVNDNGQVAGSAEILDDEAFHAFIWTPTTPGAITGEMQDLGTLGGLNSYSYNLGADGQVVGSSEVAVEVSNYYHAFLYSSGIGMVDLNTRIDPLSGWELTDASEINDVGQITGQGLFNGEYRAFLLTPALAGDVNLDRTVNIFDVNVVSINWGTAGPQGDANGDGTVNIFDVNVISANWNSSAGGATTVPEPSCLALAAIGLIGQFVRVFCLRKQAQT